MNFKELMMRMDELDSPLQEAKDKKAKKDYDGDGKVETGSEEHAGSVDKAIKKAKSMKESVVDECGMPGMGGMPGGMMGNRQPDSVNMNVSLNAAGAGGIRDLMSILKDLDGEEGGDDMGGAIAIDMDHGPEMGHDEMPAVMKSIDHDEMGDDEMGPEEPEIEIDDSFANAPDEMYADPEAVVGAGGDLHSKGAEEPGKPAGGGNPRKIDIPSKLLDRLNNLYQDVKFR
jgi:hypothetical protein